jgi:hypothetical protein
MWISATRQTKATAMATAAGNQTVGVLTGGRAAATSLMPA